ncbi:hypothetical protein STEG23_000706, partial [Scotinomys teguina]
LPIPASIPASSRGTKPMEVTLVTEVLVTEETRAKHGFAHSRRVEKCEHLNHSFIG